MCVYVCMQVRVSVRSCALVCVRYPSRLLAPCSPIMQMPCLPSSQSMQCLSFVSRWWGTPRAFRTESGGRSTFASQSPVERSQISGQTLVSQPTEKMQRARALILQSRRNLKGETLGPLALSSQLLGQSVLPCRRTRDLCPRVLYVLSTSGYQC